MYRLTTGHPNAPGAEPLMPAPQSADAAAALQRVEPSLPSSASPTAARAAYSSPHLNVQRQNYNRKDETTLSFEAVLKTHVDALARGGAHQLTPQRRSELQEIFAQPVCSATVAMLMFFCFLCYFVVVKVRSATVAMYT
jgi:hypothetical protein